MAFGVASEPVPAVAGISNEGRRVVVLCRPVTYQAQRLWMTQHRQQFCHIQNATAANAHHQIKPAGIECVQHLTDIVVRRLGRNIVDKGDAAVIFFEDRLDLLCGVETRDIAVSYQ
jgi:hypothetical protein